MKTEMADNKTKKLWKWVDETGTAHAAEGIKRKRVRSGRGQFKL